YAYTSDFDDKFWERMQNGLLLTSAAAAGIAAPPLAVAAMGEGALVVAAGSAAQGALVGGATHGLGQVIQDEPIESEELAKSVAVGAVFGANAGLVRVGLDGAAYSSAAGMVSNALHGAGASAMT